MGKPEKGSQTTDANRTSTLATTKVCYAHLLANGRPNTHFRPEILTPADFALINDLRIQAATRKRGWHGCQASLEAAKKAASSSGSANDDDTAVFMSESDIFGPRKKAKADYEERTASTARGREGREKFGLLKGRRKEAASSSTNCEKARNKPIMVMMGSKGVRGKKKQSLREKQKRLRAHIDRAKKAHH